jgi:sodium transport system ATP-binding protein|tara:strand:+ start:131 stop:463 length:333 start_codon:yes stop_codon:yes gene_type:complete
MRTALARALIHDPQNIMLDEPTRGLDVKGVTQLRQVLTSARDKGRCVVFSSHVMPEVERIADHIVIIAAGRTVAAGSLQDILQQANATNLEAAFMALSDTPETPAEGQKS